MSNAIASELSSAHSRLLAAALDARTRLEDPAYQAFWLLRVAFTVAPIAFGLDKFFHVLSDWDRYLAPAIVRQLPWSAHQVMYAVGVVEIVAGLVVLVRPRLGACVVAAWLAGIIDVAHFAGRARLKVLPPLCPLAVSATDFSRAGELIERARRATGHWLDSGGPALPAPERFLSLHHHVPGAHRADDHSCDARAVHATAGDCAS